MMSVKSCNEEIDFRMHNNLYLLDMNDTQETLLHEAAKYGNVEMIQRLIKAELNVNVQDNLGKTPIMHAIENETLECFKVIEILYEANANIHITDKFGKSALNLVINESDYRLHCIQKFFLEIIHQECMNNSEMTAKRLISLRYPLCQAVLLGNPEVIEYMIINGVPIDSCDPDDEVTALVMAVRHADLEIVKVLIKHGADVDLCDSRDFLPIYYCGSYCTSYIINQPEIVQIFLNTSTLLQDLHQRNAVCQFRRLFEYGSKDVIQILLEHYDDILNMKDVEQRTPLHYLSCNQSDVTELLQDKKINVNAMDLGGCTPIYMAAQHSKSHINNIRFLLENGADVNIKTRFGQFDVPLFALCKRNSIKEKTYYDIVEMFLQHNLDIQYIGLNGVTVFDIIIGMNLLFMAQPLLAHLAILSKSEKSIDEYIYKKIVSHESLKKCFDSFKAEIENMKNNIINNKLTLYTIFVNQLSDEDILKKCKFSPNSLSKFKNLKKKFPTNNHYYALTQKRTSSIISKLKLLQKAKLVLRQLLKSKIDVNHLVTIELIYYLDIQDLKNLINM